MELKEEFMLAAIKAARDSAANGDYGVGAVVVKDNKIIATGYETLKSSNDPVNGHAEVSGIRQACQKLQQPYLEGCVLYSTHEPCPMCISACIWAKIPKIAYGISRDDMIAEMKRQTGGKFSWRQIEVSAQYIVDRGSPKIELVSGYLRDQALKLFDLTR